MTGRKIFFIILLVLLSFEIDKISQIFPVTTPTNHSQSLIISDLFADTTEEVNEEIKFVTVIYNSRSKSHLTRGVTPTSSLITLGYPITTMNRIYSTSPTNKLYTNSFILVKTYSSLISDVTVQIPYDTVTKGAPLCAKLSEKVTEQRGVLGVKTQRIEKLYLGDEYITERLLEEVIVESPVTEIITMKGPEHTPTSVTQLSYNCDYWYGVVNSLDATEEEKEWLRFTMKWESNCNAESDKSSYKGLFQWGPCIWYKLYPNDNIFDGYTQIRNTLNKVRAGGHPKHMWPAVYRKYLESHEPLSWLPL